MHRQTRTEGRRWPCEDRTREEHHVKTEDGSEAPTRQGSPETARQPPEMREKQARPLLQVQREDGQLAFRLQTLYLPN